MKGEKIIIYNILRTIVLALCLLLLATCEVGLGPTVDTTAPELSISNPTASAILKGTISLDGSVLLRVTEAMSFTLWTRITASVKSFL